MKRNSSDIEPSSPISSDSEDFKPDITPPPSSSKKSKGQKVPSSPSPKKKRTKKEVGEKGEWTPERKAIFMDRIIAAGYKASDMGDLAIELGMAKTQLENQLNVGRKGSLREKAVQAAKGT